MNNSFGKHFNFKFRAKPFGFSFDWLKLAVSNCKRVRETNKNGYVIQRWFACAVVKNLFSG